MSKPQKKQGFQQALGSGNVPCCSTCKHPTLSAVNSRWLGEDCLRLLPWSERLGAASALSHRIQLLWGSSGILILEHSQLATSHNLRKSRNIVDREGLFSPEVKESSVGCWQGGRAEPLVLPTAERSLLPQQGMVVSLEKAGFK